MGEFKCWIEKKDNPGMTDAEVKAFQKKHLDPLNAETVDNINTQWLNEQGVKCAKP